MIEADTLFRLLSDGTRLRTVVLLALEGELCVCELCVALGVSQPKMSRHLATLREQGLVRVWRQKTWIYYDLSPDIPDWAREVITVTARAVEGSEPFASDRLALARMEGRPGPAVRDLGKDLGNSGTVRHPPTRH